MSIWSKVKDGCHKFDDDCRHIVKKANCDVIKVGDDVKKTADEFGKDVDKGFQTLANDVESLGNLLGQDILNEIIDVIKKQALKDIDRVKKDFDKVGSDFNKFAKNPDIQKSIAAIATTAKTLSKDAKVGLNDINQDFLQNILSGLKSYRIQSLALGVSADMAAIVGVTSGAGIGLPLGNKPPALFVASGVCVGADVGADAGVAMAFSTDWPEDLAGYGVQVNIDGSLECGAGFGIAYDLPITKQTALDFIMGKTAFLPNGYELHTCAGGDLQIGVDITKCVTVAISGSGKIVLTS